MYDSKKGCAVSVGVFSRGSGMFLPKPEDPVGVGQVKCVAGCAGEICRECVCWDGGGF